MGGKQVGQRRTAQREAIMNVINATDGPLTVEQIRDRASEKSPNLGIATVYRTVKLLLDGEQIHAVILPDGETRYEAADLDHHHHFRCHGCNVVFDLPGCMMPIPEGTALPGGFCVEDHEITLFGTCPECTASDSPA